MAKKLIFILLSLPFTQAYTQQFRDVSKQVGIVHQFEPFQGTFGGGATVLDINNDGWDDLYLTGGVVEDKLYLNNTKGAFTNIFASSGIKSKIKYVTQSAVSADVNKDGWSDLFITTITTANNKTLVPRAMNLLYLNNGNNTFRNATKEFGLDTFLTFSTGACFGDVNNDGYPDLFVANYFHEYSGELNIMNDAMIVGSGQMAKSYLFINKKGRRFKQAAEDYGINFKGFAFGGVFTDYNNDGNQDLIVYNDFGYKATPNFLYQNQYPRKTFKDLSKEKNMRLKINGMGTAIGDINQDGFFDYFFTNIRTNQFMISDGIGKPFRNESMNMGTAFSFSSDSLGHYIPVSWGCNFADFDNDGDLDLFVACGSLNPSVEPNPDFYFENENGKFVNKAAQKGLLNRGINRGSATLDYDNDGDLDLLVIGQKAVSDEVGTESMSHLFSNDSVSGNNWVKVSLHGVDVESRGLGARVKIIAGGQSQIREVDGGSSHMSQNSPMLHFGLGKATTIDSVIIQWVGGGEQVLLSQPVKRIINVQQQKNNWFKSLYSFIWVALLTLFLIGLLSWFLRKKISTNSSEKQRPGLQP